MITARLDKETNTSWGEIEISKESFSSKITGEGEQEEGMIYESSEGKGFEAIELRRPVEYGFQRTGDRPGG